MKKAAFLCFALCIIIFIILIVCSIPSKQTVYLTKDFNGYKILTPIKVIVNENSTEWSAYYNSNFIGNINKNDVAFIDTPEYETAKIKKELIKKQKEEEKRLEQERIKKAAEERQRKIEERNKKVRILSKRFGYTKYGERAVVGQIKNGNKQALWIRADIKLYDDNYLSGDTYTYEYVEGGRIWNFEAPTFGAKANVIEIDLSISDKDE